MGNRLKVFTILSFVVTLVFIVLLSPFFTIWSLNILFGLEIPYTFVSWCAVLWLITVLNGIRIGFNKNE